jgi:threonyl-tRNA synthetase
MEKVTDALKNTAIGGGEGKDKKPAKKEKKEKKAAPDAAASDAGPLEMDPPPAFLQARVDVFERLKKRHDDEIASKPREDIIITMKDGTTKPGKSWETTFVC